MTKTASVPTTDTWQRFQSVTARWGRNTMIMAIVLMIGGPLLLAFQVGVDPLVAAGAFLAIAAVYGVVWFVEPFSYFPILGPASMYQAFMIGNISNKLLPSAIVAQAAIGARPETKRGQLAAVLAICGAATTHLLGLLVFVGILGSVLLEIIPPEITQTVQTYVLPAVMGAAIVQMVSTGIELRVLAVAIAVALVVVLVLTPLVPAVGFFAVALGVVVTVAVAIAMPRRTVDPTDEPDAS